MNTTLQPYEPLRQVAQDLYCVDGDWFETPFRRRMTVVRLKDESLVIHSAIQMKNEDLEALEKLGPVKVIIVPNVFHDSEAPFYSERYPQAKVYVPEKVHAKCSKKMRVTGTLEKDWQYDLELACIPFRNSWVGESVFVHPASESLIVTDLAFNLKATDFKNPIERLLLGKWNGLLDGFGPSRLTRFLVARNRPSVREALKKVASYEFKRVIMSHGQILEGNGKKLFFQGYKRCYGEDILH